MSGTDEAYEVLSADAPATRCPVLSSRTQVPPNVGVVGPTCKEGNARYRSPMALRTCYAISTHMSIFGVHYPPGTPIPPLRVAR
eukprot:3160501-Rhodomonas_salina.2